MFRTTNPAMNMKAFNQARSYGVGGKMTVQGTITKAFVLLGVLLLTALFAWNKAYQPAGIFESETVGVSASIGPIMIFGGIGGLIFGIITIFKKEWASITAPLYAACEGLLLGAVSAFYEAQYPGIVFNAVALTSGTLFCMLTAYKSGMIKVNDKFRMGIVAATGAICLVYFISFILSFFGASIPLIHSSGVFGIGFSLVVVTIAALNLVLDFDFIEKGSQVGVPKYMEWYGAFGLMVTLVWLYIEILRLLSKLRSRR